MEIVVTARAILDKGVDTWDEFCKDNGLCPWCISDGRMNSSEEFRLSKEEAIKYGFIKEDC